MKQNLRLMAMLWPLLRLRTFINHLVKQAARLLRDRSQTAAVRLGMWELSPRCHSAVFEQRTAMRTAGIQHDDPTKMRSVSGNGMRVVNAHTEALRLADGAYGKARPTPCPSPPSLTLPSGPIRICPAYTSVKSPKSGTLAKDKRLYSGRKAHSDRQRVRHGSGRNETVYRLGSASELGLVSDPTRSAYHALRLNQGTTKSQPRPNQGTTKLRSHTEEPCVCTHAMAPARNGLGLALGLMATLFLTIMCLYAVQPVSAQVAEPAETAVADIKPLQIGDTIPEVLWDLPLQVVNHPPAGGSDTITLNEYRDNKLIILEFWGFSCSSCIQSVNKLDTLRSAFDDGTIAVLPIHRLPYPFDEVKMMDYIAKAITRNRWSVPSVVKDSVVHSAFSNYLSNWGDVWILDGRLLAVPMHGYLNHETISAVLEGRFVDFKQQKNTAEINPYRPLLVDGNGAGKVLYATASSTVTGHIPHQQIARPRFEYRGDSTYLYMWNCTLPDLLYQAYKPEIMPHLTARSGIIWEADGLHGQLRMKEDTSLLPFDRVAAREAWNDKNLYGYQLRMPGRISEQEARKLMQRDLEAMAQEQFGVSPAVQPATMHTYAVLRNRGTREAAEALLRARTDSTYTGYGKDTTYYNRYKLKKLVSTVDAALRANRMLKLTFPHLVDSTGLSPSLIASFRLPTAINEMNASLDAIQEALAPYNLYLTIEKRRVPMLMVCDSIISQN